MINKPVGLNPKLYYIPFISSAKGEDLIKSLEISMAQIIDLIDGIDDAVGNYAYQDSKWSIKQVLKHISDSERVHAYRALRFGRNDKTDLPGFEENDYAQTDNSKNLSLIEIKDEFIAVRNATIQLFKTLNKASLDYVGTGNGLELTPRIIGWIISGHATHHHNVIKERYLKQNS